MVTMDHQEESTYAESNGHVTDDVTWSLKIKIVTPKYLRFSVFMAVESRWFIINYQHKNFVIVIKQQI